ncbi:MAG: acyl-CoA dehydrogenase family protein [Chloroflexota bacterium]|nr:acyl-CoA dehydrogenase family protein [Chloroflexota bacterium]
MADFGFTEAQEMFRHHVRDFARRELAPGAKERAKLGTLPAEAVKKLADAGLLGLTLPEKYGGQPSDWVSLGIMHEEIAKIDFGLIHSMVIVPAAGMALLEGSEEVRREWLPALARGEKAACLCLTEPDAGSDAAALKSRAVRDGDSYVLSGDKTSVTRGMEADVAMVFAKTDPAARARGVTCFWVPLNLPGISRSPLEGMGFGPLGRATIAFDQVRVPVSWRVGKEGEGFYLVMRQFDFIRVLLALQCLGMAQASLEEATAYAMQRTAFGRPIARFEAVSFRLAEDHTRIEAARLLCYRTLWLKDQGQPHTKETAMSKYLGIQTAVQAIHNALLIHGHFGYSVEFPFEQRLRDTIGLEIGDGTADIMRVVIAREMMGREFLPY